VKTVCTPDHQANGHDGGIDACEGCIVASGAVLEKHWIWRQILADVCALPVVMLKSGNGEITMLGAAMNALNAAAATGGESRSSGTTRERSSSWGSDIFGLDASEVEVVHLPDARYGDIWKARETKSGELYAHMVPMWK
jgi:sugar (pentulose or hexulose) kinase